MFKIMVKIAAISLLRRPGRTISVIMMIGTGLWGLLFMESIYDGMIEQMIRNAIRSDSGELSVFAKGYRQDNDIFKSIGSGAELEQVLDGDLRVKSYAKRILQDGLVATAGYSGSARIAGIILADEQLHGGLDSYLKEGTYSFGSRGKGAIVGWKLAQKLKLRVGKKVIISAQAMNNEIAAAAFKVTGVIQTNNMLVDERTVFIKLERASEMLETKGQLTQFSVTLGDSQEISSLQSELEKRFPLLEIFRWDQLYPALMQSRVMMEVFNLIIGFLVFGVASLGIFGVMLVSVLERIREFGIMLALGTSFRFVAGIVLLEALFLALLGYLVGVVLGGATLYYFQKYGLDLTMFSQGLEAFGMDAITYAVVKAEYFIAALGAVCLAAGCSVVFPLLLLKKSKPIEVINRG